MAGNILTFNNRNRSDLVRIWIATGNPNQPLVSKWVVRARSGERSPKTPPAAPEAYLRSA